MRILSVALIFALGTACSGPTWRHGVKLVHDGEFYDATWFWVRALDADEYDQGALRGLDRWARDGFEQKLDIAREHEAEGRYAEALAAFDELFVLEQELGRVAALDFEGRPTLRAERHDVEGALARKLLADASAAVASERYDEAIASYERSLALRPQLPGAQDGLAQAWYRWGRLAIEQKRYPEAVERLQRGYELGAGKDAQAWAVTVQRALGRFWLRAGACRSAVTELRAGQAGPPDPDLDLDIAAAQDCARTELVVQPFESIAGEVIPGTAPGAMLSDQLEAQLRVGGSGFLKLIDPASASASVAVGGQDALARPGRLYEVRGRITQLSIERPEPTSTARTVAGTIKVLCPLPEGVYYAPEEWCIEPVTVAYEEQVTSLTARITGSVRIIDPRSSEQLLTRPMETEVRRSTVQATGFARIVDGERADVQLGTEPTDVVVAIPAEVLAMRQPPEPLPSDSALAAQVTEALAALATAAILETVDVEAPVDPPTSLTLTSPITDAQQLQLEGGAPSSETTYTAPEQIEIEGEASQDPVRAVVPKGEAQ